MERSGDGSSSTSVVLTMRPLERANDFFWRLHPRRLCQSSGEQCLCCLEVLCLSKKGTVYHQKVIFEKDIEASEDAAAFSGHFCTVVFATCEGCVAGADGGLCSHVIALFLVLEKYRTSSHAVTSLPRSWGPRKRNIDPQPIMNITVEKSKMDSFGENISCTLDDARSEHLRTLYVDDVDKHRVKITP